MEISRGKQEAKGLNCYRLTLNVWEGNDSAKAFYDKMGMNLTFEDDKYENMA